MRKAITFIKKHFHFIIVPFSRYKKSRTKKCVDCNNFLCADRYNNQEDFFYMTKRCKQCQKEVDSDETIYYDSNDSN